MAPNALRLQRGTGEPAAAQCGRHSVAGTTMEPGREPHAAAPAAPGAGAGARASASPRQWRWLVVLRSALYQSVVIAVVGLVALPIEALRSYLFSWSVATFGQNVCPQAMFLVRERYLRREPFTVHLDRSTPVARANLMFLAYVGDTTVVIGGLFYFYIVIFGGTRTVWLCFGAHLALYYAIEVGGYVFAGFDFLRIFAPLLAVGMIYAAIRRLCHRTSNVPWHVVKQVAAYGIVNLALTSLGRVNTVRRVVLLAGSPACSSWSNPPCAARQDFERFVQSMVLLNLVREAGRVLIVNSAYYLTSAHMAGDDKLELFRDACIVPVFLFQCVVAVLFRLEIANFDDERVTTAVIVLQGAIEIVLRLTARDRDAWVKRVLFMRFLGSLRCCKAPSARQATVLVLPVTAIALKEEIAEPEQGRSKTQAERFAMERVAMEHERSLVAKRFAARLVLCDMLSEYCGIYVATYALLYGQNNPLAFPMRPFRKNPELLDGATITPMILYVAATQVATEIATDTMCLCFEMRIGLNISEAWRRMPKLALLLPVIVAIWAGSVGGQFRNVFSDDMRACDGMDMCFCVGGGLLPGGMRELYCKLLYPASGGFPPASGPNSTSP
jgi:hypothetical protein